MCLFIVKLLKYKIFKKKSSSRKWWEGRIPVQVNVYLVMASNTFSFSHLHGLWNGTVLTERILFLQVLLIQCKVLHTLDRYSWYANIFSLKNTKEVKGHSIIMRSTVTIIIRPTATMSLWGQRFTTKDTNIFMRRTKVNG